MTAATRGIYCARHVIVVENGAIRKVPAIVRQSDRYDGKFRPCRRLPGGRWVITKRYVQLAART